MMDSFLEAFDFSKETSLYIHVPFCTSKCSYCAFYSVPCTNDAERRQAQMMSYVDRLLSEIGAVNARMDHRPYRTAFIGGGNPGCLGPELLGRVAEAVCANGRPEEFSVEMNPESLSEGHFPLFGRFFTRLSMGVQSLDQRALRFLGRNADMEQTRRGLELSQRLRSATGCTLSYDLITCLGSWHDELADVREITERYPSDHLSVYALTLEEGTPLYRMDPELPDSEGQFEILSRIWELLERRGFEHYEVSNFAKPGHRCIHNCRYWDYRQYVGLGPGAASTAFDSLNSVTRFNFRPDVAAYCAEGPFQGVETERLDRKEALEELVLMGLRYKGGLDTERVEELSGRALDFGGMALEGYHLEGKRLVPDDTGLMTADAAASRVMDFVPDLY
ncbi:MAG: coproporphyrinogen III oxidase family protein [Spirochaetales bacterium]|nr:coproporphyrinogen III oxidase family protein [Spirochaetales bacterium]